MKVVYTGNKYYFLHTFQGKKTPKLWGLRLQMLEPDLRTGANGNRDLTAKEFFKELLMFLLVLSYKALQFLRGLPNLIFPVKSVIFHVQFCRKQGFVCLFSGTHILY